MERMENVTWSGFQHGVNLGGWFSQCDYSEERYRSFICERDLQTIAAWGLDHVRLPVDYNLVQNEDGTLIESGFQYIQTVIDWCRAYGLNLILDLHKTIGFSFDAGEAQTGFFENESLQEYFYQLWEAFAVHFAEDLDILAFELLNEVTDREYASVWNRIARECIRRIRKTAPEVPILVGGYWNNSIDAVPDLEEPCDEHIIYNFHCYDPLLFTHQGAPWVQGMDHAFRFSIEQPMGELRRHTEAFRHAPAHDFDDMDPDQPLGAEYFLRRFEKAVEVAKQRHVRLYCGEYGVIDRASPEDALKWYEAIHQAFETYGIGRAAWSYREMDFGISDPRMDSVRSRLIELL